MTDLNLARLALEASIEHWRQNEEALHSTDPRTGSAHCALCEAHRDPSDIGCGACPVAERTGENFCDGTPYDVIQKTLWEWDKAEDHVGFAVRGLEGLISDSPKAHAFIRHWRAREAFLLAARDERLFLESLRD